MSSKITLAVPKVSVDVTPLETVFEVAIPSDFIGKDYYRFTVSSTGEVTINDNVFPSAKTAGDILKAVTNFLQTAPAKK